MSAGKGDKRRPSQITQQEELLRWELFKSTTSPERKVEIKKQLEAMKNGESSNSKA